MPILPDLLSVAQADETPFGEPSLTTHSAFPLLVVLCPWNRGVATDTIYSFSIYGRSNPK